MESYSWRHLELSFLKPMINKQQMVNSQKSSHFKYFFEYVLISSFLTFNYLCPEIYQMNYSLCWEFFTDYNDPFSHWRMLLFLFIDLKYGISLMETWYWSFIFHKKRRLCFFILGLLSANHFFLFTILCEPSAEYESILETILFTAENLRILKIRRDLRNTRKFNH